MKVELGAGSTLKILLDKALLALKRTLGKLTEKEIKFENEHPNSKS